MIMTRSLLQAERHHVMMIPDDECSDLVLLQLVTLKSRGHRVVSSAIHTVAQATFLNQKQKLIVSSRSWIQ